MVHKGNDVFEFSGKKFLASGTSGCYESLNEIKPMHGTPVRGELEFAGKRLELAGTSGNYNGPMGNVVGRPVQHGNIFQAGQQTTKTSSDTSTLRIANRPTRIS
jgi:hypothetical protein